MVYLTVYRIADIYLNVNRINAIYLNFFLGNFRLLDIRKSYGCGRYRHQGRRAGDGSRKVMVCGMCDVIPKRNGL
jgi:hypothetical protein